MTTDTTALQERIARVLHEIDPISGHGHDWRKLSDAERKFYIRKAAAVLPTIETEVQAAKAEALREAAENVDVGALSDAWTRGAITRLSVTNAVSEVLMSLRARATEHETGDQA